MIKIHTRKIEYKTFEVCGKIEEFRDVLEEVLTMNGKDYLRKSFTIKRDKDTYQSERSGLIWEKVTVLFGKKGEYNSYLISFVSEQKIAEEKRDQLELIYQREKKLKRVIK